MELTVGTALQGDKYVIREVLSQSDAEILYKATHTYLDQFVLLRSLPPAARQRDDFAQVKQRFITEVRSQAKQATPAAAAVLDCFEEGDLPFVVLQFKSEQVSSPTKLQNQTIALSSLPSDPSNGKHLSLQDAPPTDLLQAFDAAIDASTKAQATPSPNSSPVAPSPRQVSAGSAYEPIVFQPMPSPELTPIAATNGHNQKASHIPSLASRKRLTKLPIALLAVALVGGCIGVGTGMALRYDAVQSQTTGSKPRLGLFNREQSFPSQGNWPVQEPYMMPEPTIEQPLYRATPLPEYNPSTVQPLPETFPTPEPYAEEPKSVPDTFSLPQDSALPINPATKLPVDSAPLTDLGNSGETAPPPARMEPISPDNLLPPTTVAPAPVPPPAANSPIADPPPLKSLPNSSGI